MDYLLYEEMILAAKKKSHIIFAARFSYMGRFWYNKVVSQLCENGRVKLLFTDTFFKYDKLPCISIGRFSKTPSKVFVL